jgi:hypothetical protein
LQDVGSRFTKLKGGMAHEITCINKDGHKLLQTQADSSGPSNLLGLPECP